VKAIFINENGSPDVIKIGEFPLENLRRNEVRIKVIASGINHLDIWVRKGIPGLKLQFPHILGADASGIVEEIGEEIEGINKGDKVLIYPATFCGKCEKCVSGNENLCKEYKIFGERRKGVQSEYINVPKEIVFKIPEGISFIEASAIPLSLLTAMQMVEKANIEPGMNSLVMAGSSGVSLYLIQILKIFRCNVFVTASSKEKIEKAKEFGAIDGVNYNEKDWEKKLKNICEKIDVIFDHTGKEYFENLIKIVNWGGKIIICGATSGYDAKIDLRHVFFRQIQIIGSTMGGRRHLLKGIEYVKKGFIKVPIFEVFNFEKVKEAHKIIEERKAIGKIVLEF
jgi:NADPH:quinone reductase-like Zn-dependent oxidoreductase